MHSNRLCLNSDKTELIWVSTPRLQHQLLVSPMLINGSSVKPVRTVRNLGVFINADRVMRSRVTRVVAQCFAVLRHLRLISRLLSPTTLKTVVVALVLSRLDYANSVLSDLPAYACSRCSMLRLVWSTVPDDLKMFRKLWCHCIGESRSDPPERIQLKLAVLVYRVLHGNTPDYLGPFTWLSSVQGRSSLRSSSFSFSVSLCIGK